MRFKELLEYDTRKALNQWGEKLLNRVSQEAKTNQSAHELYNRANNVEDLINWFEEQDPTQDNKYTEWLIRTYVKGGIEHLEDIPQKANRALQYHNRLSRSNKITGQQKNIDSFKSLGDLQDLIDEFYQEKQTSELDKKGQELLQSGQAELVYNGPDYRIVVPKTHEASCYFGSGTRWCTTESDNPRWFKEYNKEGNFYYVTDKNQNTKLAINFGAQEYRDAKDEWIEPKKLLKNYPELIDKLVSHIDGWEKIVDMDFDNWIGVIPKKKKDNIIQNLAKEGSLGITDSKIQSLPKSLHVNGNFLLLNTRVKKLPTNLEVEGNLEIWKTPVKELPANLKVGKNLILFQSSIESVPINLQVNGYLDVYGTPLGERYNEEELRDIIEDKGGYIGRKIKN